LVRLYPDLDNDSRSFLKYGPRSPAEKLAYAQRVNPLAHLDALPAPQDVQQRFQDTGELEETDRFFVGPDGRIYLRNEDSDEQLGAKVRRGYEQAIGGFDEPTVKESLSDISESTRAKRADVELHNPPTMPEQEERERMLAPYNINPAAWQSGTRAKEEDQRILQEAGYLWDAIYPWSYIGPDGALYYKNELTRPEPFSQRRRLRDWSETQNYLRTLPPPTVDELQFAAMANGGYIPGGRHVRFANSKSGRYVRPGSLEAGLEIRARLADIPRLAALYGWKQAPQPATNPQALKKRFWRKRWGRRGSPETRDDLQDYAVAFRGDVWKHTGGSRDTDGNEIKEKYHPNYFGGREGSNYDDISFIAHDNPFKDYEPYRDRDLNLAVQHSTVDPKTLKPTFEESRRHLKQWIRDRGYLYVVSKRHQLEEAKRRKLEEEEDAGYIWPDREDDIE
jgi:hypothetical protein